MKDVDIEFACSYSVKYCKKKDSGTRFLNCHAVLGNKLIFLL